MGKDPMIARGNGRDAALDSYRNDTNRITGQQPESTETIRVNFMTSETDTDGMATLEERVEEITDPVSPTPIDNNYDGPIREFNEPAPAPKAKKSKLPVILLSVLAIILVAVGALAIWFFAYYSNPDRVVFDAVNNFTKAENVAIQNGGVVVKDFAEDGSGMMLQLQFDSASSKLPNATNVKAVLNITEPATNCGEFDANCIDDQESQEFRFTADLGTIVMNDGVVYLQVSGLVDAFEQAGLSAEATPELADLLSTVELIDGEWWQISLPDILETIEIDEEANQAITDAYACMIDLANSSLPGELGDIYNQHRFLEVAKIDDFQGNIASNGSSLYSLNFKAPELANFLNAVPNTAALNAYYDCFNKIEAFGETIGVEEFNETTPEEITESLDELPEDYVLIFEISNFTHQLESVIFGANIDQAVNKDEPSVLGSFVLSYQSATITAPAEYRPITELFEQFAPLAENILTTAGTVTESHQHELICDEFGNCTETIIYEESTQEPQI